MAKNTVGKVSELVVPVAQEMGLKLWDIKYIKEGSAWFLKILVDKDGGIDISDCEDFSRAVSKVLDEKDPIESMYYLEVGSPGIERELDTTEHFEYARDKKISVKFIRPFEDKKEMVGILKANTNTEITLEYMGEDKVIPLSATAKIKIWDEKLSGGLEDE